MVQRATSPGTVRRVEGSSSPQWCEQEEPLTLGRLQSAGTGAAYPHPGSLSVCGRLGCTGLLRTRVNELLLIFWYQSSLQGAFTLHHLICSSGSKQVALTFCLHCLPSQDGELSEGPMISTELGTPKMLSECVLKESHVTMMPEASAPLLSLPGEGTVRSLGPPPSACMQSKRLCSAAHGPALLLPWQRGAL